MSYDDDGAGAYDDEYDDEYADDVSPRGAPAVRVVRVGTKHPPNRMGGGRAR